MTISSGMFPYIRFPVTSRRRLFLDPFGLFPGVATRNFGSAKKVVGRKLIHQQNTSRFEGNLNLNRAQLARVTK